MDKIWHILKSSWGWLVTVPLGIFTAYNIIRQEINPKLPPLINFIGGWHWGIWLLLFLLAVILIIIESLWRYNKEKSKDIDKDKLPTVKAKAKRGGQSIAIGRDNYGNIYQQEKSEEYPNVDIEEEPYIKTSQINMTLVSLNENRKIPIFPDVFFAQVSFSNNPKTRSADNTAKNVRAKITYSKLDKSIIRSVSGRWAGNDSLEDSEIIDLLSNGKPRVLYLAMKYEDDSTLYMYGMETNGSYLWKRHEDDSFRIYEKQVYIKVEIIGEKTGLIKEFRLYDEGENGLRIEVLDEGLKSKSKKRG